MACPFFDFKSETCSKMSFFHLLTVIIGVFMMIKVFFVVLQFLAVHFMRSVPDFKKHGSWAIVTGSTDGIGRALSFMLAKKGFNLLLVSRSKQKLKDLSDELLSTYSIQVRYVDIDFSGAGHNGDGGFKHFSSLRYAFEGLDIGLVFNNCGVSYDHAEYLKDLFDEKIDTLLSVNCLSLVQITKMAISCAPNPKSTRNKLSVVNISSISSIVDEPLYSVYSASKSFVNTFSQAMNAETPSNISVQSAIVGFVPTKLSKIRRPGLIAPSADRLAESLLKFVGRETVFSPWWTHDVLCKMTSLIPSFILQKILFKRGLDIRRRAYLKKEREQREQLQN